MSRTSKSIERTQDIILGQFKVALNSLVTENVITMALDAGEKATIERNKRQAKALNGGNCISGLSTEKQAEIERKIKLKNIAHEIRLKEDALNRNRHSLYNTVLDIFETDFLTTPIIDADVLTDYVKTEHVLIESDLLNIKLIIDKALTSSVRCFIECYWKKSIFMKGPNFDNDKTDVIKSFSEHEERIKFTAPYGCVTGFRKGLLKPMTELITKHKIEDTAKQTKDIWSF